MVDAHAPSLSPKAIVPHARAWLLALLLVPSALAAERFAYYGARSIFVVVFRDRLASTPTIVWIWTSSAQFSPFVGGAIALAIGTRGSALLGGVLTAAGLVGLGVASSGTAVVASIAVFTIGSGALYVSALSFGALTLRPWSASGVAAASAMMFAGINVGAALSTRVAPFAVRELGQSAFLALAVFAFAAAAILAASAWLSPAATPAPEQPLGASAMLAALLILFVPFSLAGRAIFDLVAPMSAGAETGDTVFTINSFAELIALFAACAVFLFRGRADPSLIAALAGALAAWGLAAVGASAVPFSPASGVLFSGLFGASGALVDLLVVALIGRAFPTRFVPLALGGWFTAGRLLSGVGAALLAPRVVCAIGGLGAIAVAASILAQKAWWSARIESRQHGELTRGAR